MINGWATGLQKWIDFFRLCFFRTSILCLWDEDCWLTKFRRNWDGNFNRCSIQYGLAEVSLSLTVLRESSEWLVPWMYTGTVEKVILLTKKCRIYEVGKICRQVSPTHPRSTMASRLKSFKSWRNQSVVHSCRICQIHISLIVQMTLFTSSLW